ncbi:MAG: hypothetical protein LBP19_06455 [Treponema sp.]|nr:hypothetical protein [Treponema sp.]
MDETPVAEPWNRGTPVCVPQSARHAGERRFGKAVYEERKTRFPKTGRNRAASQPDAFNRD